MNDKHKLLATKLASLLLLGIVLTIFPGIIISTAIDNGITAPVTGVAVIVFGLATTSLSYIFGKQLKLTNHPRTPYNLFSLNPSYMNEDTERVRTETVPTTTPKQEVVIPTVKQSSKPIITTIYDSPDPVVSKPKSPFVADIDNRTERMKKVQEILDNGIDEIQKELTEQEKRDEFLRKLLAE